MFRERQRDFGSRLRQFPTGPIYANACCEYLKLYRRRNEVERLFGRLKRRFRRIFTRYNKLDPR